MAIYENDDLEKLNDKEYVKNAKQETLAKKARIKTQQEQELKEFEQQFSLTSDENEQELSLDDEDCCL